MSNNNNYKIKQILKKNELVLNVYRGVIRLTRKLEKQVHRNKILFYYKFHNNECNDEVQEILDYIKEHPLGLYNYKWVNDYQNLCLEVYSDDSCSLNYFLVDEKKIYYNPNFTIENAKSDIRLMMTELDSRCPHCYTNYTMNNDYDIVIDAGVAEGMFSLSMVGSCKQLYLVEADHDWCRALHQTFHDYDNVKIINKKLSDKYDKENITVDDVLRSADIKEKSVLIKMDIEGSEEKALQGMKNTLKNCGSITLLICSYHHKLAERNITEWMQKNDIKTRVSKGYIFLEPWYERVIFSRNHKVSAGLRRALVVGERNNMEVVR